MQNKDSIVLSIYLFLASVYYLFSDAVRLLIFGSVLLLSVYMSVRVKGKVPILKTPVRLYVLAFVFFTFTLFAQVYNRTLTPFAIYYLTSPLVAYFVFAKRFNVKIITLPLYLFSTYVLFFFLQHRNLIGVMSAVSENYVSVVLIMNLAVIYIVRYRQKQKLVILPALIGLFLSILAIGRSGIIVSLFILLLVLWMRWRKLTPNRKIFSLLVVLVPIVSIAIINWDFIVAIFYQVEVFEKFSKSGVSSPSRDIIKRAYLSNINSITLFTGYNYIDNYWFQHYGFNPHNSYIRLHYLSGAVFFIIIPLIIVGLFKLVRRNIFFAGLLIAILIRSWTDSVLFLTLFDFVPLLLLMFGFFKGKTCD